MDVADLSTAGAGSFAGGEFVALHEASVGGEILDGGKSTDVVDFVEDDQREDLADAGYGSETEEGVGVML